MKQLGDKLLFAQFPPSVGRASPKAGQWFGDFLRDINLRDETPGACILGMHAFRSTFLHWAQARGVVNSESITGHASNVTEIVKVAGGQVAADPSQVVRTYRGERPLPNKAEILEQIQYDGLSFFTPVALQAGGLKL